MFGSQALETAIGLATLFFILATAASAVTEVLSRLVKKRAVDLERTIDELLSGKRSIDLDVSKAEQKDIKDALDAFKSTSIWQSAKIGAKNTRRLGRSREPGAKAEVGVRHPVNWVKRTFRKDEVGPSYLSAKAFAEAIIEMFGTEGVVTHLDKLPVLQKRVDSLIRQTSDDVVELKAGLEGWFDESMQRMEGAYKKWATVILFIVGLLLAVGLNASATNVAHDLWQDSATRQVVAASAADLVTAESKAGGKNANADNQLGTVAKQADELQELSIPVGWGSAGWAEFKSHWLWTIPGWLLTALLVMLGGPFWFDLLSRLVSLRVTGSKPPTAAQDDSSATSQVTAVAGSSTPLAQGQQPPPKHLPKPPPATTGRLTLALESITADIAKEKP